jgi:hypothetical protein
MILNIEMDNQRSKAAGPTEAEWQCQRERIMLLYRRYTVHEVRAIMQTDHHFKAR